MNDMNVIDRFLAAFIRYIDSGFGLLGGDVAFLTSVLVGIDITLAGLFWAMGGDDDIIGRFLKKTLYVGAFALILGNFQRLSGIVFRSFTGLGLTAGGGTMSADDLLRPGHLAGTGFEAAWPLLDQASDLLGFTSFFDNFLTIAILLLAWLFVIVAFFVLAVQLFVTILEFKLTTLAGFVLVPFALWNRTVSVQVTSVVRASERSFQVDWTETAYERGSPAGTSRWTAILSVEVKPPKTADELRKNPLGLRIDGIDWSRELDPVEPPPASRAPVVSTPPAEPSLPLGSPLDPGLESAPSRAPASERIFQ